MFQMASDGACCVTAHTDWRQSAIQAAQWESQLREQPLCLWESCSFLGRFTAGLLHHGHANKVLDVRQKPITRRGCFVFLFFWLHVVVWPWTVLHAGVMTAQSAGVSLACTQGQSRALEPTINIRVKLTSYYMQANMRGPIRMFLFGFAVISLALSLWSTGRVLLKVTFMLLSPLLLNRGWRKEFQQISCSVTCSRFLTAFSASPIPLTYWQKAVNLFIRLFGLGTLTVGCTAPRTACRKKRDEKGLPGEKEALLL